MIRVERMGALAPDVASSVVRDQLRLAHRYRNTLTEIERGRRAALRDAESAAGLRAAQDALREAEAAVDAVLERVAAAKVEGRTRAAPKALRDELAAARAAAKEARLAFRAVRDRLREETRLARAPLEAAREALDAAKALPAGDPGRPAAVERAKAAVADLADRLVGSGTFAGECERINRLAGEMRRSARANCGVFWGTYLLVEAAFDQAAKVPLWDFEGRPNDPPFVRWEGEGSVGVQIQGGMTYAELCAGEDTRARLTEAAVTAAMAARVARKRERLGDPSWEPRAGAGASRARTLWLRVGSGGESGREPVWATFPVTLTREVPADAVVKGIVATVRRVGDREEWSACMTLDAPETSRAERCGEGAVAVHLGWRRVDGELRAAVALGADGRREEVVVPERMERGLTLPRGIQGIRDRHFESIRATLLAALKGVELPDALAADVRSMHAWRSLDRMRAFVRRWAAVGAPGGDAPCADAAAWRAHTPEPHRARLPQADTVAAAAEAWRAHDVHLLRYQEGQRLGELRNRRERYRVFAAGLARRYGVLVLDDADRAELARRQAVRPANDAAHANGASAAPAPQAEDAAQSNRHLVAVSELEQALKNAFRARGGRIVEVPCARETLDCSRCGAGMPVAPDRLHVICDRCGARWDQDDNAARNMLAAFERSELEASAARGAVGTRGSKRFVRKAAARSE